MAEPLQHELHLDLASGAQLTILYFSDQEMRWIFNYRYIGLKAPGANPEIANDVKLTADYTAGLLDAQIVLSMHVIIPERLGQEFFAGMDISPGAKTYLEFTYKHETITSKSPYTTDPQAYRLIEIQKGARKPVRVDDLAPGLIKPIDFPFPIPDRLPVVRGRLSVPFLLNNNMLAHFDLPMSTVK